MATTVPVTGMGAAATYETRAPYAGWYQCVFVAVNVDDDWLQVVESGGADVSAVVRFCGLVSGQNRIFVFVFADIGDVMQFTCQPTAIHFCGTRLPVIWGGDSTV